jgi:hypothetical protein
MTAGPVEARRDDMDERIGGAPAPSGDAASDGSRDQVTVMVRPIGAPTPIGLFGLAAAAFVLRGPQRSRVDAARGRTAEVEHAGGRAVVPFGRRGKGEPALHGSRPAQVGGIATGAGVRTKL